jgi:hypothetical protein
MVRLPLVHESFPHRPSGSATTGSDDGISAGDLTVSQEDGPSSLTLWLALFLWSGTIMLVMMQNDWMQLMMLMMKMTADDGK